MMRSYDSILAQHEHLRGHTITHAGWDELSDYLSNRPNYKSIDEFFTPETEAYMRSSYDEPAEPIAATAALFVALSNPTSPELDSGYVEVAPDARSLPAHVDIIDGDIYLANFGVINTPSYVLYPHITKKFHTFTDEWGAETYVQVDAQRPERVRIASRQLVVLTASVVSAKFQDRTEARSTIPHGVEVSPEDSRTLLIAHAVNPVVSARIKQQDQELVPA